MPCHIYFKVWTGSHWDFHTAQNAIYSCEWDILGYTMRSGPYGWAFYEDEIFSKDERMIPVIDYDDNGFFKTGLTTPDKRYIRFIHGYVINRNGTKKLLVEDPTYEPKVCDTGTTELSYLNKQCVIL